MSERSELEHPGDDRTAILIAYANGTLDAAGRADVEAALADSAELRGELAEIQTIRHAMRAEEPPPAIPAGVWERLGLPPGQRSAPLPPPAPIPRRPLVPPSPAPAATPLPARRPRRLPVLLAAAAAVAVVVAGVVVISRVGSDEPGGEAVPPVTGDGTAATAPGPDADPLDAEPVQALRGTAAAMQSARTATLDVSGQGVATFDGSLVGEPGTAEVVVDITGDGAVDFGTGDPDTAAYRLTTALEGVSGPPIARPERTTSDTIVVDGRRYTSEDGGPYTDEDAAADPDDEALFAAVVLRPDLLARLPDLADGEVDDLGREMLDGTEVRHLHFDLEAGTVGDADSASTADVWIDGTGVVRKLRVTSSGPLDLLGSGDAALELTLDIDLRDVGAAVEISAPS